MNKCTYCGLEPRDDYPVEFRCGSVLNRNRSRACLVREVGQLKDRVKELESAGDLLADWHLSVVTTREKAERDVARWNEAKGEKP
jgi:hypothetical protein